MYQTEDVNLAVELFSDKFTGILDRLAILTIQTRNKYVPWLSQETKNLMQQRDQAQGRAASSNSQADLKLVTSRLRVEESNWQSSMLRTCTGKPSEQWQLILGWLDWKSSGSPTQLYHNGKMLNKPSEIADCQNEFFVNKVKYIRENLPAQVSDPLAKLRLLEKLFFSPEVCSSRSSGENTCRFEKFEIMWFGHH